VTTTAKLTPRQRQFVAEYIIDPNATQAAIKAGYSPKTAYAIGEENLRKPVIRAELDKERQELAKRNEIDQDWVIKRLILNADRAAQAEPVLDTKGVPTGEYRYDGAVVNKALELIGKHIGMFVERTETSERRLVEIRVVYDTAPGPTGPMTATITSTKPRSEAAQASTEAVILKP